MQKITKFILTNIIHSKVSLLLVILFLHSSWSMAQCDCKIEIEKPTCNEEIILEFEHGKNITEDLKEALNKHCKIRIKNTFSLSSGSNSYGNIVLLVSPMRFYELENKEIILEQGVTLKGIVGGYSDCSQAIFTFESENVKNITIRGEYDVCLGGKKPIIKAIKPSDYDLPKEGFLVAADEIGEPYLNQNNEPNYIFSDGDSNPYFDDNGNPNFITNNAQQKVEKSCDYNDFVCNRDIVVWCPMSLESRHLFSIQGAKNIVIDNLDLRKAGGDAIHITDDKNFKPSQFIKATNIDFFKNGRTGVVFSNSSCSSVENSTFEKNGKYFPTGTVESRGAVAFHQNSNIGSITAYNGKQVQWTQKSNTVSDSKFLNNANFEFGFNLPLPINTCENITIGINNNCVTKSENIIGFNNLSEDQSGKIKFKNLSVYDFTNSMVYVDADYNNNIIEHVFDNVTSFNSTNSSNVYEINSPYFCKTTFVNDWCQNSNQLFCDKEYDCDTKQDYVCPDEVICCEYSSGITTKIDSICECDFLFVVDESGSVQEDEWEDMECTIFNMMADLNNLCYDLEYCFIDSIQGYDQMCVDSLDSLVRFAVVQWSNSTQQHIYSDFDTHPFNFEREFDNNGTALSNALDFVNTSIDNGDLTPRTRYPYPGDTIRKNCLQTIILTDAPCSRFNDAALIEAVKLNVINESSIYIVDYSTNSYDNCPDAHAIAIDGGIYEANFNCENSGIIAEDFIERDTTHTIYLEYEECNEPNISWLIENDGSIIESNADSTIITVINAGLYTATISCETGCSEVNTQSFDIDGLEINNINDQKVITRSDKPSRDVFYQGEWYSPHEMELIKTNELIINEHTQLNLYPNPSNGKISFLNPLSSESGTYEIMDIQGNSITSKRFNSLEKEIKIDLNNAPEGILIIKITGERSGKMITERFININ